MSSRNLAALLLTLLLVVAAGPASHAQASQDNPLLLDSPDKPVPALDFTAKTLTGQTVHLSDFRGKVVLLNFWATWCVPCQIEMPAMERLSQELAGEPFALLAVNQAEAKARVLQWAQRHNYSFEVLLDPIGEIGSTYGADRLPMSYIIDKNGLVIRRAIGPRRWDGPVALHFFQTLMSQRTPPDFTGVSLSH